MSYLPGRSALLDPSAAYRELQQVLLSALPSWQVLKLGEGTAEEICPDRPEKRERV